MRNKTVFRFLFIIIIGISFLLGYMLSNYNNNKTTYHHVFLIDVQPDGSLLPEEIFFEISREGKPKDLIDKYLLEEMQPIVPQIMSYSIRIEDVGNKIELKELYQSAEKSNRSVEYIIIDNNEPEPIVALER